MPVVSSAIPSVSFSTGGDVLRGGAEHAVAHGDVPETANGRRAHLDQVAVRCGDAVGDGHVFAGHLGVALEANRVVVAIDQAVGNDHVAAVDVDAVVVITLMGIDPHRVDAHAVATMKLAGPARGIAQRHLANGNVAAILDVQQTRPARRAVALFEDASVAIDHTGPLDPDILGPVRKDKTPERPRIGRVVRAPEHRPALQPQRDMAAELQRCRDEYSRRHDHSAAARRRDIVDHALDQRRRRCWITGLGAFRCDVDRPGRR